MKKSLLLAAFAASLLTPLRADSENRIILDIVPTREHPRNSEGSFATLRSGRIIFYYSQFDGGRSDESPSQIAEIHSDDHGLTWSQPQVVIERGANLNAMSVTLRRLHSGKLALFYLIKKTAVDWQPYMRISTDEAASWSEARRIFPAPGAYCLNNDRVIQTARGRLILPVAYHRPRDSRTSDSRGLDRREIVLWYHSDDEGATWQESPTSWGLPVAGGSGLQEPGAVELADGSLFSWARTDVGMQYGFRSSDGGETWSPPQPTELKSPCSPACIKRLPNSSALLAIYNDHSGRFPFATNPNAYRGRSPLVAAISTDGGRTWPYRKVLEGKLDGEYCYTAIHFVGDSVLLAYFAFGPAETPTDAFWRLRIRRIGLSWLPAAAALARGADPDYEVRLTTIRSGFDGKMQWMNPMLGAIPRAGQDPLLVLTLQKALLSGSDVYFGLNEMRSGDYGRTWSGPVEVPALGRRPAPDGMQVGLASFAPKWNPPAAKLLGIGGATYYIGDEQNREGPKRPAYSVYDAARGRWSPWAPLVLPDSPKFHMVDAGACQRVDLPDGTILQPAYFKAKGITAYSATVLRCSFDGTTLTYLGHGDELTLPFDPDKVPKNLSFDQRQFIARQRGLWEPSLTRFHGGYFLTLRGFKDNYVTRGPDGQRFAPPRPWKFDDGAPLGSENTQTHWVSHGDRLYLVYTRRGADNDHVFRHRAPVFMARVDPRRLCLIRATETILMPSRGAALGGIVEVTEIDDRETWVVAAESMQKGDVGGADFGIREKYGANNRSYAARIVWR